MNTRNSKTTDEAKIRTLIDERANALRNKDASVYLRPPGTDAFSPNPRVKVSELGGAKHGGPIDIGIARLSIVADPQGAMFALYDGQLEP